MAQTYPAKLGLPFGYWTLDRLATYLRENKLAGISQAQLASVLITKGLHWYQEQTYFTEQ